MSASTSERPRPETLQEFIDRACEAIAKGDAPATVAALINTRVSELESERDHYRATNARTIQIETVLSEYAHQLPGQLIDKLPPDLDLSRPEPA